MKVITIALMTGLSISNASLAADMPDQIHCIVSGTAGCSDQGGNLGHVFVGAGTQNKRLHLTIDTKARTLDINGIRGRIADQGPIDKLGSEIYWDQELIAYNKVGSERLGGRLVLNLTTPDGGELLEFTCRD